MFAAFLFSSLAFFIATLVLTVIITLIPYRKNRFLKPFLLFGIGTVISALLLFIPQYIWYLDAQSVADGFKVALFSMHNTIRLFVVDSDFSLVVECTKDLAEPIKSTYQIFTGIIFFICPFFLFGTILSFFKNLTPYRKLYFSLRILVTKKALHIFSTLNEKTIILAESILKESPKNQIVFTSVDNHDASIHDLIEKAKEMDAIIFAKSIDCIRFNSFFSIASGRKEFNFYFIDIDKRSGKEIIISTINDYRTKKQLTNLYMFTNKEFNCQEILSYDPGNIRVRRIDVKRSVVESFLFNRGNIIFDKYIEKDGKRVITAVIVGFGHYGRTMVKYLTWLCQIATYEIHIHVYDRKNEFGSSFESSCPELMDSKHNGNLTNENESRYDIKIHKCTDVESKLFFDEIMKLDGITHVFVSLGDDELNKNVAVNIALSLKRKNYVKNFEPYIQAISHSYDNSSINTNRIVTPCKPKSDSDYYKIDFFGSRKEVYSYSSIIEPDYVKIAKKRHLSYCERVTDSNIEDFYRYEYNYRSSISSVIFYKYLVYCRIPGANVEEKDRTKEESYNLKRQEHCRWNAFLRSEGWCFGEVRDNGALVHNCLVPFDKLSVEQQNKDSVYFEEFADLNN